MGRKVNTAPTTPLDVFVFGEGRFGELGLGRAEAVAGSGSGSSNGSATPTNVKRPRINTAVSWQGASVTQIACGARHVVALTDNNLVLTWGANELGALGRAMPRPVPGAERSGGDDGDDDGSSGHRELDLEEEGQVDMDESSVPRPVDMASALAGGDSKTWTQVAASDSATFVLSHDGFVYGWGSFRGGNQILGFNEQTLVQRTPCLVAGLRNIRQLVAGANHVLALDGDGKVFAWGSGQNNQLARRVFDGRHARLALKPASIGALPIRGAKAVKVACGHNHSFAIDQHGRVYAWGQNNYGELGVSADDVATSRNNSDAATAATAAPGESDAAQLTPCLVRSLQAYRIVDVAGGEHHSLACTDDGRLLTWGRVDGGQVGLPARLFTADNAVLDEQNEARILKEPTLVPGMEGIVSVAAGSDHSLAITADGKAYSWGFSQSYQTGHGRRDDVAEPLLVHNAAISGRKVVFAGAGNEYSILASVR